MAGSCCRRAFPQGRIPQSGGRSELGRAKAGRLPKAGVSTKVSARRPRCEECQRGGGLGRELAARV